MSFKVLSSNNTSAHVFRANSNAMLHFEIKKLVIVWSTKIIFACAQSIDMSLNMLHVLGSRHENWEVEWLF